MSFGINLKRERELRGITLEEISNATKISVRLLMAIEADRFDILPEGLFRKSFIKSYAKYLGMKEESILQEYHLSIQANSSMAPSEEKTLHNGRSSESSWRRPILILVLVLMILAGGAILWHFKASRVRSSSSSSSSSSDHSGAQTTTLRPPDTVAQTNSSPSAAEETIVNSAGAPTPSQTRSARSLPASSSAEPSNAAAAHGAANNVPSAEVVLEASGNSIVVPPANVAPIVNPRLKVLGELPGPRSLQPPSALTQDPTKNDLGNSLELLIEATAQTWLSVNDVERTIYLGIMKGQESRRFPLEKPLKLVVGNAGGVKLSVNGQALAALGRTGEKKVMEISAQNYRQFLASGP